MAEIKKLTKKDYFNELKVLVADRQDLVDFIDHEIELLSKKSSRTAPTKTQVENEKKEDKIEIADIFGTTPTELESFLVILSNYRNLCAHEDIVFEHRTERWIPDTIYHEKMNIDKMDGEYIYGKHDLFAVIIIM